MRTEIRQAIDKQRREYDTAVICASKDGYGKDPDDAFDELTNAIHSGVIDELLYLMKNLRIINIAQLFEYIRCAATEIDKLTKLTYKLKSEYRQSLSWKDVLKVIIDKIKAQIRSITTKN